MEGLHQMAAYKVVSCEEAYEEQRQEVVVVVVEDGQEDGGDEEKIVAVEPFGDGKVVVGVRDEMGGKGHEPAVETAGGTAAAVDGNHTAVACQIVVVGAV